MKRLTQKNYLINGESEAYVYGGIKHYGDSYGGEVIDKLAEYEDLEEQGLLLRLPVSDGFTDDLLNMGYTKGYHKAIDDFAEALVKHTHKIPSRCLGGANVLEIAEKMKAGGEIDG